MSFRPSCTSKRSGLPVEIRLTDRGTLRLRFENDGFAERFAELNGLADG